MAFPFLYYSNFQREALRRGSCHRLWNVSYSNSRPPLPTNLQDEPKRMSATRRRAKTSPCARAPVLRSSQSGPCFPPASFATELQVIYEHSTGSGGVTGPGSNHSDAEPRPWLRIAPLPGARSRERSRWLRFAQTQAHSQSPPAARRRPERLTSQRSQCGFAPSGREPASRHDNRPCGARPAPTPQASAPALDPPPHLPSCGAHTPSLPAVGRGRACCLTSAGLGRWLRS